MSDKDVYIHIGAPKTATTLLQHALNKNRSVLQTLGYDVLLPGQIRDTDFYDNIFAKHTNQSINISLNRAKNDFNNQINQCQNKNIILSEEGFTQNLMPTDLTNRKFSGIRKTLSAIKSIVPSNTTIVFSIRNQVAFIESTYKHKIKWKFCSLTFEEYLQKHIDRLNISWAKVIGILEEYFPNKVQLIPFELIHVSNQCYLNCFFDAFKIKNPGHFISYPRNAKNESLADNHALFMRNLNKKIKQLDSFNDKTRPKIKVQFVKELLEFEPKKSLSEFKMPANNADFISDYYHKENMQILQKYCSKKDFESVKKHY